MDMNKVALTRIQELETINDLQAAEIEEKDERIKVLMAALAWQKQTGRDSEVA